MNVGKMSLYAVVTSIVIFFTSAVVFSASTTQIQKEISSNLRQAERMMFSGKKEEADAALVKVRGMLDKLHSSDPECRALQGMESRYKRTRTSLDKRMKKSVLPT